jgi:hypothetical protein
MTNITLRSTSTNKKNSLPLVDARIDRAPRDLPTVNASREEEEEELK